MIVKKTEYGTCRSFSIPNSLELCDNMRFERLDRFMSDPVEVLSTALQSTIRRTVDRGFCEEMRSCW
jgi:hypothetical protein